MSRTKRLNLESSTESLVNWTACAIFLKWSMDRAVSDFNLWFEVTVMGKSQERKQPQFINSPMGTPMLNYKVYYMQTAEKVLYELAVMLVGGLAGLVFYGGLFKVDGEPTLATSISNCVVFIGVGLIAARFFLPAINSTLLTRRQKNLRKQFMDLLETLSTSLSAGNTMYGAIVNAKNDLLNQYSEKDMIIVELGEIITGIDNGKTIEEMLHSFGERSNNEDILNFSNVVSNCYRMGGNFGVVVRHTREIIGDKVAVEDEIATKIASNKLQHNAMCIMPIALVAMLKIASPDFANNLNSVIGVVVTTFAIGIFIASYFWGQKIISIG